VSTRDGKPEDDAADLNKSKERGCPFGIAGRNSTPAFKVKEGVLNQMAQLVEILVVFSLDFSVPSRRNNRFYSLREGLRDDSVGIVTTIS
jgi:hypothetical protein